MDTVETTEAEVIDLRDPVCPQCGDRDWTERLGSYTCTGCGLRVGDLELPPIGDER